MIRPQPYGMVGKNRRMVSEKKVLISPEAFQKLDYDQKHL
jgi:hypothetical protein